MESNCPSINLLNGGEGSPSETVSEVNLNHLAASSEIDSKDTPVSIPDTGEHEAQQPNETLSKSLNHIGENFDEVLSKMDSTFVELNNSDINNTFNPGSNEKFCEAIVKISKPLCADYRSDTETDSVDSESDSSTSTDETTDSSSDSERGSDDSHDSNSAISKTLKQVEKKGKRDITFADLPPIEDLKISVPENACVEIGRISSIVESLVVVESYKGTAALDVDTVLFLDCGKRTLGKVFDILGPITEPVYTVRFNSEEQIKGLNIEKDEKVYYAPKTEHTMFVFLSEVLKNKGSDASWKDNIEAPPEFQDFSDDEQERLHKNKDKREPVGENTSKEFNNRRKRSFSRTQQPTVLHPPRLMPPLPAPRPPPPRPLPGPFPPPQLPRHAPPYPGTHLLAAPPPAYAPPPFPAFSPLPFFPHSRPSQLFHPPFFQQRTHSWGRQMFGPPPPPPPPDLQRTERNAERKS